MFGNFPAGEELNVMLIMPEYLTYSDEMVSFKYSKHLNLSKTALDYGIQCMVLSTAGNGYIIQILNVGIPNGFIQRILNELTEDDINLGYTIREKVFTKNLISGQTIEGIQTELTNNGRKQNITVAAYSRNDKSIIIITMLLSNDFREEDRPVIDLFLETLEILQ